jgi:drug/metabolite transporter (DMT)-like permease
MTRRGLVLFLLLGIAWGIPYVFIKIADAELSPLVIVLCRTAIGAVVLIPIAAGRGQLRAVFAKWRPLLVYTVLEIIIPWFFLTTAEKKLPSSTAGLLLAAVPLVGVLAALLLRRAEKFTWRNWVGIAVGMIGVVALVGFDVAGSDLIAVGQIAITVLGYAIAPIVVAKWMSDVPGIGLAGVSLGIAAIVYAPAVFLTGSWPHAWPSWQVIVAILVLAFICSAVAFVMLFALIGEVGPVRATTVTYLNPAVAIVVGALLLHEQVTGWTIAGFVLVIAGSLLVQWRKGPKPGAPTEPVAIPVPGPVAAD